MSRTRKVQLAFWNFPLGIHSNARSAAIAAECAASQGRFWDLHDALFASSGKLSKDSITANVKSLDLNFGTFESCAADDRVNEEVESDVRIGAALGVKGTPALFVGTRQGDGRILLNERIAGARPFAEFQAAFEGRMR